MRIPVLVGVLAFATTASAEPERSGLMLGASLGGGGSDVCRDCVRAGGVTADIHAGWWINRRLAVGFEEWVFVGSGSDGFSYNGSGYGLAMATVHVAPRWWIKGGAGVAMYFSDEPFVDSLTGMESKRDYKGVGLGSGVGYELFQSKGSFVVEASSRLAVSLFPDHGSGVAGSVGIGIGWN